MIRYFVDKEQEYLDELLFHLRSHNYSFTNDKRKIQQHIYILEDNQLLGYAKAGVGWSWANIGDFYYKNTDVLKALVEKTVSMFQDQVFGIKTFTKDVGLMKDLQQVGFQTVGSVPQVEGYVDSVYLDLLDYGVSSKTRYSVNAHDEMISQYSNALNEYRIQQEKLSGEEQLDSIVYACKDDDMFCGGVQFEVYKDHIYTHLLAVNKEYARKGVGSVLMQFVEEYAKKHGIQLLTVGTTEFQARPFYEKLGYKVVFTRQNNPEGYECYTLIKELKE